MDGKMCGCSCGECKGGSCHGGQCGGCFHAGGHNWLLRLILGLVLLFIVFKLGMALGEFKGEFGLGHGYGPRQMMNGGMMGNYGGASAYDASDIGYFDF